CAHSWELAKVPLEAKGHMCIHLHEFAHESSSSELQAERARSPNFVQPLQVAVFVFRRLLERLHGV
ncbi:unnamed protein product, partial [Prorocentrum cordatum]